MDRSTIENVELKEQVDRLTALVGELRGRLELIEGEPGPNGPTERTRSRRDVLKLAGVAAAGAVGAAVLGVRGAKDVYATTTDTNFVATGNPAGGVGTAGTAFLANSNGNFGTGLDVTAFGNGISSVSTGSNGIYASGGSGGASAFFDTGGRVPLHLQGGKFGTAGPPTSGSFFTGDIWPDVNYILWVCIVAGSPGTWVPLQPGGYGTALQTAVSTKQYSLGSSDGITWVDIDAVALSLSVTPSFNVRAVISANIDLWTTKVGLNQDIGIFISGGAYGAGYVVYWKESGGFATYAPNAAHAETVQPLAKNVTYTIKLQWKGNASFSSPSLILAGAGPLNGAFSPTRLTMRGVVV